MDTLFPAYAAEVDDDELKASYDLPASDRPHVRASMVGSLDGGATLDGTSQGLSSPADAHLFTLLRDCSDVILVGAGTVRDEGYGGVLLDEGRRERRERWGFGAAPPMAVLTRRGLDPSLKLFTETDVPPILLTTEAGARATGQVNADVAVIGEDTVDLAAAIAALSERGLQMITCEGGPSLLGNLVQEGLLDELCLAISPTLLGAHGAERDQPTAILGDVRLTEPARWKLAALHRDGSHLFARYLTTTEYDGR